MTDTYIWQKVRERFLGMEAKVIGQDGNETDIIEKEHDDDGSVERYANVVDPNDTERRGSIRSSSGIWFEIFPLHSPPSQQELGSAGRNRWNFGMQININSPRDMGTYAIDTVYDAIASRFRRGDIFDGIRVMQTAYRSSARLADDYYSVPVTVMVQADLEN